MDVADTLFDMGFNYAVVFVRPGVQVNRETYDSRQMSSTINLF